MIQDGWMGRIVKLESHIQSATAAAVPLIEVDSDDFLSRLC